MGMDNPATIMGIFGNKGEAYKFAVKKARQTPPCHLHIEDQYGQVVDSKAFNPIE